MTKNYDNFFISVRDMNKSIDMFQNILGLKLKFDFRHKGIVAFSVGDDEPAIILKDLNIYPEAKASLWFEVQNVNEEYEILKSKGIKFITPPFAIKTGNAAEFEDEDGNRFGIADYIK